MFLKNNFKFGFPGLLLTLFLASALLVACGDTNPTQSLGVINSATVTSTTSAATTAAATTSAANNTAAAVVTTASPATTSAPTTNPATTAPATTKAPTTAPVTTAVPTTVAPQTTAPSTTGTVDQSIRKTNWVEVFKNDPAFKFEQNIPPLPDRPYVTLKTTGGKGPGGFPYLDGVVYVDMDNDGKEEAAISLTSGGTAGDIAFLVFRQASPRPTLVTYQEGYKLGLTSQQGKLTVIQPIYAGWEPNCCANGQRTAFYALQGNKLTVTGEKTIGYPEAQPGTVEYFYLMISTGKFELAYEYLAPSYQKANPFDSWRAGFATTREVKATASAVAGQPNTVKVDLVATDSTNGGGTSTKKFTGTWKLEWSPELGHFLMSDPAIKPA